jgi:hypothetical protein
VKRFRIALLAVLPTFVACSETFTTAPAVPLVAGIAPASVRSASQTRPFSGRCDTDIDVVPPIAGDPPNLLRLHVEYVCQLQHLGRTTATTEQIVIFTGPTTAVSSSYGTYTAANGDQLFATWTGTATSVGPLNTFSGPQTITGGTGRFAGATGSTWVAGTASLVTFTGQFTSEGTLTY